MARRPLYYTFGNHMHWVDMQWLWGYDVLPGSVDDMLALIEATGARGNINFDAVGYEKMAGECPEHLAKLKQAVSEGKIEPVGCSYGQPYGLFHGGESNIRQLTYGVRTTRRLLGVRPRAFWEEEFYFFPQLPQMLAQCGYAGACLFFQWTWHTPELPKEAGSLILWEGIDGTRLPALPRGQLNVHQWPEDFEGVLEKAGGWGEGIRHRASGIGGDIDARGQMPLPDAQCLMPDASALPPAIIQWLELMPSRDWMCRSEVLLPRLKELMGDERFEIRARTVSGVIAELMAAAPEASVPVRRYSMDDVWHGMTLGKNGDRHPRRCRALGEELVAAEAAAATASLLGRPYAQWDVYPTWEAEDAWRELLAAQHHDNHECEGLCGHVAYAALARVEEVCEEMLDRTKRHLLGHAGGAERRVLSFNPTGRAREMDFYEPGGERHLVAPSVPAFGYRVVDPAGARVVPRVECITRDDEFELRRGAWSIRVCRGTGAVLQAVTPEFPDGMARRGEALFRPVLGGRADALRLVGISIEIEAESEDRWLEVSFVDDRGKQVRMCVSIDGDDDCFGISVDSDDFHCEQPGFGGSLCGEWRTVMAEQEIVRDTPYGAEPAAHPRPGVRKYPEGDWMTSPQWFEKVQDGFTSYSWVDVRDRTAPRGLLIQHTGSQQWFLRPVLRTVITARDPWDEKKFREKFCATIRLFPHGSLNTSEVANIAAGEAVGSSPVASENAATQFPAVFGPLEVSGAPNVLAHAFFRESMKSGEHVPEWAGHRMARESGGECTHPFVIRLVEWDGEPAEVVLKLAGKVAMAAKTNLLGEVLGGGGDGTGWLEIHAADPPEWAVVDGKPIQVRGKALEWSEVRLTMRPREIATIYADMVLGRKEFRDLDAKREVWATVHKRTDSGQLTADSGQHEVGGAGSKSQKRA